MWHIDRALETFGVEAIPDPTDCTEFIATYCNTGDTYALTVCLMDGCFIIASWGDVLEQWEKNHFEETGEQGCSYCGTFTDRTFGRWGTYACSSECQEQL